MKREDIKFLIIIVIIFGLVILSVLLYNYLTIKNKNILVFSPDSIWECNGVNCKNIPFNEYDNTLFNVYVNSHSIGKNYVQSVSDKFYVFNDNNDSLYKSGNLFAYNKKEIKVFNFVVDEIDNTDLLNLRSVNQNIDFNNLTVRNKIILDFDGDGETEQVYYLTNLFAEEGRSNFDNNYFSVIYYKDGEKISVVKENIVEPKNQYDICVPSINYLLDINNDGKIEIIESCEYYNLIGNCTLMYKLKNSKYEEIKSCSL